MTFHAVIRVVKLFPSWVCCLQGHLGKGRDSHMEVLPYSNASACSWHITLTHIPMARTSHMVSFRCKETGKHHLFVCPGRGNSFVTIWPISTITSLARSVLGSRGTRRLIEGSSRKKEK